ncbi:MAG: IS21 family transposase [Anaerolineales bacterium]
MRNIREILRLKWDAGRSHRAIARSCGISPGTVSDYLQRARLAGLSWPLPEDLTEAELERCLFPEVVRSGGQSIPLPDWKYVHGELRRKGVTLRLLWVEYRDEYPNGYGYSQFCDLYRRWSQQLDPPMRLRHKAGETLFVDYAGQTLPVVDLQTGEVRDTQLFVAVLGASSYGYAEAHWQQDLPNWIGAHVRAFSFFGGTPEVLVPDNLKAGVKSPCRYEPDINPTYHDLAQHYSVAVVPARVRAPKDKAKVEVGVQVAERWILARLRDRTLFGLSEANGAIGELLGQLNDRPMQHLGQSRRELFETLDKPALQPLPAQPYEFAFWKKTRVNIDYHVEFDKHFYSVPHTLIRKGVDVRATENTVEIFYKHERQASHPRSHALGRFSTRPEHMPPAHRAYSEWSPERFLRWAEKFGPHTAQLIEAVLAARKHPQQAYRTCLGILGLGKRYTDERLEAACRRALAAGIHSYKGVRNILDAQLDRRQPDEPAAVPLSSHANIRGEAYYH